MSTPINSFLRGTLSQKSRLLLNFGSSKSIHTMSANLAGHRIERDTFGESPIHTLIQADKIIFVFINFIKKSGAFVMLLHH